MENAQHKIRVAVCIPAYNEAKNIRTLIERILRQRLEKVVIEEIVVISSGSQDGTNRIIAETAKLDKRIRIIVEAKRKGKFAAVNRLIQSVKSDIIVLESADTLPQEQAVEELCLTFLDGDVGMAGARTMPLNGKGRFIDFTSSLMWYLHHLISLERPKFGEMVAFRNIVPELALTSVDEEGLAAVIKDKGLELKYAPKAVCYNRGPGTLRDFWKQRRRIFAGHLALKNKTGYCVPTLDGLKIFKVLLENFPKKYICWTLVSILLEVCARCLGLLDFYLKKEHIRWPAAKSTKELNLKDFDLNVGFDF